MVYRLIVVKLRKEAAMDTITTQSKGSNFVEVKDEFVLDEKELEQYSKQQCIRAASAEI